MKIDSKGNMLVGSVAILIVSLLLISIFIITSINYIENGNIELKSNNNFKYIIDDYSRNLEVLGRDAIAEATQKVYNGLPVFNSKNQIKKNLNNILKEKNASIEGLRDPLPLAKLTIASGILTYDNKIHYKNAIAGYMVLHHLKSPESYIEATAPLYIKKCPYDPYIHHGDPGVLKDCLDKGYFHESADGSCYLCRLEGKGKCPHYGMEVFIQTHTPLKNESLSCSDHVVFSDHYNGEKINPDDWNSLILDSSHKKKYGLGSEENG